MSSSLNERRIKRLLNTPLFKWKTKALAISQLDRLAMASAMESDMQRMALLSEYLANLYDEPTHEAARKAAGKRVVKIRKALGYTFPADGLNTVKW